MKQLYRLRALLFLGILGVGACSAVPEASQSAGPSPVAAPVSQGDTALDSVMEFGRYLRQIHRTGSTDGVSKDRFNALQQQVVSSGLIRSDQFEEISHGVVYRGMPFYEAAAALGPVALEQAYVFEGRRIKRYAGEYMWKRDLYARRDSGQSRVNRILVGGQNWRRLELIVCEETVVSFSAIGMNLRLIRDSPYRYRDGVRTNVPNGFFDKRSPNYHRLRNVIAQNAAVHAFHPQFEMLLRRGGKEMGEKYSVRNYRNDSRVKFEGLFAAAAYDIDVQERLRRFLTVHCR